MIYSKTTSDIGSDAEAIALKHLKKHGLVLIDQNFRCRFGEIDLIMSESETLVFIEVRYRRNSHYGSPIESVTNAKQEKVRTTAQHYLLKNNIGESRPTRFDVIGIVPNEIAWIKNAF